MRGSAIDSLPVTPESSEDMPVVFIVDDDASVRESLEALVRFEGWKAEAYSSASAFLARPRLQAPSCLVLDISLPDLNGLELQARLAAERNDMPIIFITGHGDIPMTVQAMKSGAVEFLTKPFQYEQLLHAIRQAIEHSRAKLGDAVELQLLRHRYESLTRREREVMALVVAGRPNKQVAYELDISEVTVQVHRGRAMRKMGATSLPALVNMASRLQSKRAPAGLR